MKRSTLEWICVVGTVLGSVALLAGAAYENGPGLQKFKGTGTGTIADPYIPHMILDSGSITLTAGATVTLTNSSVAITGSSVVTGTVAITGTSSVTLTGASYGAGVVTGTTLRTTLGSDDPAVASLSIMDDWDSSDACKSVGIQASKTATVSAANTVAAAGDYDDNDIMSQSASNGVGVAWKFTGLGRIANGTGTITGANIVTSVEGFTATVRLHLFNADPSATTEKDDNAALAIDLDDRAKYLGYIDIGASADFGEFSFAQVDSIAKKFTADASGDVYAIVQLTDAVANESASMTVYPTLHVLQD